MSRVSGSRGNPNHRVWTCFVQEYEACTATVALPVHGKKHVCIVSVHFVHGKFGFECYKSPRPLQCCEWILSPGKIPLDPLTELASYLSTV